METVIYTQRVEVIESYQERRDCADQRIADFIHRCGFLPIPVPNRKVLAERLVEKIQPSGIVLTGGNSLTDYGGNAPERDEMDEELIKIAVHEKIPLFGFCRGMQSILSHFGNKLVTVGGHVAVRHVIQEREECYEVNSYHNQACRELRKGCGLVSMARTADGIIEAVRHEHFPIVGIMWHPEREESFMQRDMERIKELFSREKENGKG